MLLLLVIIASFAEIISIGSVLPIILAIMDPQKVIQKLSSIPFIDEIVFISVQQFQIWLTLLFVVSILIAAAVRILLSWVNLRLAYAIGADLSYEIYWRTLNQPYSVHIGRNSSQILSVIVSKVSSIIAGVISPILLIISSFLLFFSISAILFIIEPKVTIAASVCFGLIYVVLIRTTKELRRRNAKIVAEKSTEVVKSLQEGLGAIRDILLDGSQKIHCEIYRNADNPLRRSQGNLQFLAQSPRFFIEAVGMIFIAVVSLILSQRDEGFSVAIPALGALAIGSQRLLPIMQQTYVSWTSLTNSHSILKEIITLLNQPLSLSLQASKLIRVPFSNVINFRDVYFNYDEKKQFILNKINLDIKKGSRVGIIGPTGSGKSTLIDLLMGLLQPSNGFISVDGVVLDDINLAAWQKHIAHVPQNIFLTDNSIAENIAFGVDKKFIDFDKVQYAANLAQISEVIEKWPDGYQTRVGERGLRLSGGQRQRIGIARALYKNADVIIFDEATSALDNETEKALMDAIDSLSQDFTIIIVAHRISTLSRCTEIIQLDKNGNTRIRNYDQIVENNIS
jgi:ABC-type multidrug transport system fused ATPase/permease subunit